MSPDSFFHRRQSDNALMINDFEFTDSLIEPFVYPIVPHIRDWVWAFVEDHAPQSLFYAFDGGYGPSHAPEVVEDACQAYIHDLSCDDRMALHEKKLVDLTKSLSEASKHMEWSEMIGTSLLASLSELRGAPRDEKIVFENALREIISTAQTKHFHLACDMDDEQDWEPIVDVAQSDDE